MRIVIILGQNTRIDTPVAINVTREAIPYIKKTFP